MGAVVVVVSLVIAMCLGGSVRGIEKSGVRGLWFPIIAIVLQPVTGLLCNVLEIRNPLFAVGLCLSYACSAVFIVLNIKKMLFSIFFALGTALNFIVIAANDFYMPVRAQALQGMGLVSIPSSKLLFYTVANSGTRLAWLSDIIYIPVPFMRGFASIGDILIAVGIFFLVLYMLLPESRLFAERNTQQLK